MELINNFFVKREFIKAPENSLQIHHDGKWHWVCSRNTSNGIYLYDSAYSGVLVRNWISNWHNCMPIMNPSSKLTSCQYSNNAAGQIGLFVASVCLSIASGGDPVIIRWRQTNMRTYLRKCIENESLSPFPTIRYLNHHKASWPYLKVIR